MFSSDKERESPILQIINIVKLSSLAFPAIAFLQYFSYNFSDLKLFLQSGFLIAIVLSAILAIFVFWTLLQSKISDSFPLKLWIDPIISLSIAFLSIMLTGAHDSNYKFLLILVIISSSIELSRRAAISISGLSAVIILGMDLVCAPKTAVNTFFESDIVLACVFLIISWTIGYYVDLRKAHIKNLKNQANIDGLTGLYNHRYFYDYLAKQIELCKNDGTDLSLLFLDIDDFKCYNDLYGHQKGDEVLRVIAGIMKETVRSSSFVARYGGEEFAILLPHTGESAAMEEAEKLRRIIQDHRFKGQENLPGENLTISIGISSFPAKAKTDTELVKSADDACYRAKFLYKNRVEVYNTVLEDLQNDINGIDNERVTSIRTLIAVINAKDKYTYGHVERVVLYCTILAEKLELGEKDKRDLIYSAYLHDIGKINISEDLLMKTEQLSAEEWEILKSHPQKAVEIIENIKSLKDMVPVILQHHERFDGSGYPGGLRGEQINYLARILSIADSFDAMTSIRPYQAKKTYNQAKNELIRFAGTQFDPKLVRVFVEAIKNKV